MSLNSLSARSPSRHCALPTPWRSARVTAAAAALALAAVPPLAAGRAQALPPEPEHDFHVKPSIGWSYGDQRLDISFESRFRTEWWDAFAAHLDTFYSLRTRVGAKYSVADKLTLFGEFQDARIYSLGDDTSGAGALYRSFGKSSSPKETKGDQMRQVWVEVRPIEGLAIRAGRQDIKLGTQALYPEANWKYLKVERLSQRMVGSVGWSVGERANDGGSIAYDARGHHIYAFAANPTTGVFDISSAYHRQQDIVYGGLSWTVRRGTWIDNSEFRPFFLAYNDDRPKGDGGLSHEVEVYTLGLSALGVYPVGPGNFDLLFWGAGQAGRFDDRDHLALAGILEAGYQFTEIATRPWFRAGVNVASGGDEAGDHTTFFNMLPTNHLYYGFADQLAFQNLIDLFGQLKFEPHARVGVNVMFHQFWLSDDDDFQYAGTGAFSKRRGNFGYSTFPSGGKRDYGRELDIVANVVVCKAVSIQGGYSHLWGGDVVDALVDDGARNDDDVDFGYLQVLVKY